jgi:hypothetical protein
MYVGLDALQVVSFQIKKGYRLEGWYYINWWFWGHIFKMASYDGRDLNLYHENHVQMLLPYVYDTRRCG